MAVDHYMRWAAWGATSMTEALLLITGSWVLGGEGDSAKPACWAGGLPQGWVEKAWGTPWTEEPGYSPGGPVMRMKPFLQELGLLHRLGSCGVHSAEGQGGGTTAPQAGGAEGADTGPGLILRSCSLSALLCPACPLGVSSRPTKPEHAWMVTWASQVPLGAEGFGTKCG